MPNRLVNATSPYLQQHADNPVDWWEWCPEAFDEARRRDVPVFLSVGYSACHWCHVMAHESFEDAETAEHLNAAFVSIKVDREERPDIDAVYMDATQALTGHGGWPMSVFLDHDGKPFYAGTYFPPTPRHGMPSFRQLLTALATAWREQRGEVRAAAARVTDALAGRGADARALPLPDASDLARAVEVLSTSYDAVRGGFGAAPKFPPSMVLEWLLRHSARTGDVESLAMAERTLEAMARGGMYDQLGGGFARYSVDADWVVPHFEKMLYDNGLLLRAYAHWWRQTESPLARTVVHDTADFLLREMRTAEGGFAAALDADSEGEEGRFYVWTPGQLVDVLGADDGAWAADLLSVTPVGTFEHGASTLQLLRDPDDPARWLRIRAALMTERDRRVRPGRDDKVVAAWNGMAIAALAEAGALFDRGEWISAACDAADLLSDVHMTVTPDGARLARTSRDGVAGLSVGVLDDYACLASGLHALYAVTGEERWLGIAGALLDTVLARFADGTGGFFDTADDAEVLIRRPREPGDNATPSGWLAAASALLTHSAYTGRTDCRSAAEAALGVVTALASRAPRAVGTGLSAAEALLDGPLEIAIVGAAGDRRRDDLHRVALTSSRPGAAVALGDPAHPTQVPLLRDRPLIDGAPAAYVCRHFTCDAPVTSPATLRDRLARG